MLLHLKNTFLKRKDINFLENLLVISKIEGYEHGYFNKAIYMYKISISIWICDQSVRKNGAARKDNLWHARLSTMHFAVVLMAKVALSSRLAS